MLAPLERHGPALGRCSGQESTWATGGILPFPDKLAKSFLSVKIEISATWTLLYLQNFMILDVNALWNNFLNSSKTMILNPPNAVTFNTVRHVVVTPINWIISLQFHYCNFTTVMNFISDYVTPKSVATQRLRTTALKINSAMYLNINRNVYIMK